MQTQRPDRLDLVRHDGKVDILSEIVVPEKYFKRISFGSPILDEMFGGQDMPGILAGSTFLFTGAPGAGKSTMCLQLADLLQKNSGRSVLYNVGEENKEMVKLRAKRIGVTGNFSISNFVEVEELVEYCKTAGVEVLFQDSLQSLKYGDLEGNAKLKAIAKLIQVLGKDEDVTAIVVGHSVKGGKFAGPQEIKHDLDGHAHLNLNPETGNRIFELEKNRFGPAMIPYEFLLGANGVELKQVEVSGDEAGPNVSRQAERRDAVRKLIKERLEMGEKLSGYCFQRLEVDCSGGFWRGQLEQVVNELKCLGHKVGELRLNGRLHFFLYDKQHLMAVPKGV